jgi:hypothetical protein
MRAIAVARILWLVALTVIAVPAQDQSDERLLALGQGADGDRPGAQAGEDVRREAIST